MPKEKIYTTGLVKNTFEESEAVKFLLPDKKPKIILVTSAFHMHRSKKLFEKNSFEVIPYPVDFKSNNKLEKSKFLNPTMYIPNASSLNQNSRVIREFIGRIVYELI